MEFFWFWFFTLFLCWIHFHFFYVFYLMFNVVVDSYPRGIIKSSESPGDSASKERTQDSVGSTTSNDQTMIQIGPLPPCFKLYQRVRARWWDDDEYSRTFYNAIIIGINADQTYCVLFEDGDVRKRWSPNFIADSEWEKPGLTHHFKLGQRIKYLDPVDSRHKYGTASGSAYQDDVFCCYIVPSIASDQRKMIPVGKVEPLSLNRVPFRTNQRVIAWCADSHFDSVVATIVGVSESDPTLYRIRMDGSLESTLVHVKNIAEVLEEESASTKHQQNTTENTSAKIPSVSTQQQQQQKCGDPLESVVTIKSSESPVSGSFKEGLQDSIGSIQSNDQVTSEEANPIGPLPSRFKLYQRVRARWQEYGSVCWNAIIVGINADQTYCVLFEDGDVRKSWSADFIVDAKWEKPKSFKYGQRIKYIDPVDSRYKYGTYSCKAYQNGVNGFCVVPSDQRKTVHVQSIEPLSLSHTGFYGVPANERDQSKPVFVQSIEPLSLSRVPFYSNQRVLTWVDSCINDTEIYAATVECVSETDPTWYKIRVDGSLASILVHVKNLAEIMEQSASTQQQQNSVENTFSPSRDLSTKSPSASTQQRQQQQKCGDSLGSVAAIKSIETLTSSPIKDPHDSIESIQINHQVTSEEANPIGPLPPQFKLYQRVIARWYAYDPTFYNAMIVGINADQTYCVLFEDGDVRKSWSADHIVNAKWKESSQRRSCFTPFKYGQRIKYLDPVDFRHKYGTFSGKLSPDGYYVFPSTGVDSKKEINVKQMWPLSLTRVPFQQNQRVLAWFGESVFHTEIFAATVIGVSENDPTLYKIRRDDGSLDCNLIHVKDIAEIIEEESASANQQQIQQKYNEKPADAVGTVASPRVDPSTRIPDHADTFKRYDRVCYLRHKSSTTYEYGTFSTRIIHSTVVPLTESMRFKVFCSNIHSENGNRSVISEEIEVFAVHHLPASRLPFVRGQRVRAFWHRPVGLILSGPIARANTNLYPARIVDINPEGKSYHVSYEDGDVDLNCPEDNIVWSPEDEALHLEEHATNSSNQSQTHKSNESNQTLVRTSSNTVDKMELTLETTNKEMNKYRDLWIEANENVKKFRDFWIESNLSKQKADIEIKRLNTVLVETVQKNADQLTAQNANWEKLVKNYQSELVSLNDEIEMFKDRLKLAQQERDVAMRGSDAFQLEIELKSKSIEAFRQEIEILKQHTQQMNQVVNIATPNDSKPIPTTEDEFIFVPNQEQQPAH